MAANTEPTAEPAASDLAGWEVDLWYDAIALLNKCALEAPEKEAAALGASTTTMGDAVRAATTPSIERPGA
jgi:hypothetical protein